MNSGRLRQIALAGIPHFGCKLTILLAADFCIDRCCPKRGMTKPFLNEVWRHLGLRATRSCGSTAKAADFGGRIRLHFDRVRHSDNSGYDVAGERNLSDHPILSSLKGSQRNCTILNVDRSARSRTISFAS